MPVARDGHFRASEFSLWRRQRRHMDRKCDLSCTRTVGSAAKTVPAATHALREVQLKRSDVAAAGLRYA